MIFASMDAKIHFVISININTIPTLVTAVNKSESVKIIKNPNPKIYVGIIPQKTDTMILRISLFPLSKLIRKALIKKPIIKPPVGESKAPKPLFPPENTGSPINPSIIYKETQASV